MMATQKHNVLGAINLEDYANSDVNKAGLESHDVGTIGQSVSRS